MSAPLAAQLLVAVFDCPGRRIDQVVTLGYRGLAEGHLKEDDVTILAGAAELRRRAFAARREVNSARATQPRIQRREGERYERRKKLRTWSSCGALPDHLRAFFTPGENAVAAIIRAEVRKHGYCDLPYRTIATAAGLVGTTIVKRFVREARRRGLIHVQVRPVRGQKNDTNIITIISRDWLTWLSIADRPAGGIGGTKVPSYRTHGFRGGGRGTFAPTLRPLGPAEKPQGAREGARAGPARLPAGRWEARP